MPITSEITVGSRVSYEDMANPLRAGTVTDIDGQQYQVTWDDDSNGAGIDRDWSDLRQYGWKQV